MSALAEELLRQSAYAGGEGGDDTAVDFVIPVYNEVGQLEASVRRLDAYLRGSLPYAYRITIADNASTDGTWAVAQRLASEMDSLRIVHLDEKGRGRALRRAWSTSRATVVAYMDVDLSTDLRAIQPLVAPLLSGHSQVAIGTRLARDSNVVRGPKRELISRCYNLILRGALQASFSDAQCGFKAMRRDVANELLPLVEDEAWFFDTEMLVLAQRAGLRIHEVPVDWVDDPDSRVDIVSTATADLRGVARLLGGLLTGRIRLEGLRQRFDVARPGLVTQLLRFAVVGVLSTAAYFVLYLLLRGLWSPQTSNVVALLATAIGNTAVNRRFTFGQESSAGAARHHVVGLGAFAAGLALTSGSLWLLRAGDPSAGRAAEIGVLVSANALTTLLRFVALRWATAVGTPYRIRTGATAVKGRGPGPLDEGGLSRGTGQS